MKKLISFIFLLLAVAFPTPSRAGFWSNAWNAVTGIAQSVISVGTGVVKAGFEVGLNLANTVLSNVGLGFINHMCGFEKRLAWYVQDSCWFCGVYGDAFDIMNNIVTEMCQSLQSTFLTMLGLGMLFWLLFRVGKVVINVTADPDVGLLKDVLMQVMRVSIASLLIVGYVQVFHYVVGPLLQFGIGLGNRITTQELKGYRMKASRSPSKDPRNSSVSLNENSLCPQLQVALSTETAKEQQIEAALKSGVTLKNQKAFNDVTKESFLCYIRTGSAAMATGMAVGATAVHAWGDMNLLDKLRHMQLPMIGVLLFLSFFLLFILFPIKLFDPLVNLTFIAAMYPLWIVMWAFPQFGKDYAKKALDMFISVIIYLIVLSIMSVVAINIMNNALGNAEERQKLFQALKDCKRAAAVFEGVGETEWTAALGGYGLVGKASLMTFALGYFSFKLLQKTDAIAKEFKGGIMNTGVNDSANAAATGGLASLGKAGVNIVSTGWHVGSSRAGIDPSAVSADEKLGRASTMKRFASGALWSGALGAPGLIYKLGTMKNSPTPVAHTGTGGFWDSLRTSKVGLAWNRLRGRNASQDTWTRFKDRSSGSLYRLDKKTNIGTRVDRDGSITRYDRNNFVFSEADKKGQLLRSYNLQTGKMVINGKSYVLDAKTNTLKDMEKKVVSDPSIRAEALALRARADGNRGWSDFDQKFEDRGW